MIAGTYLYRVSRFGRLPASDQWLLVRATALLASVRFGMCVMPFRTLRPMLAYLTRCGPRASSADAVAAIENSVWAVDLASRCVPGATCLARALTVQVLLGRQGIDSAVRFGVGRGDSREFRAHAWVEYAGRVILGATEDLSRYAPLPSF